MHKIKFAVFKRACFNRINQNNLNEPILEIDAMLFSQVHQMRRLNQEVRGLKSQSRSTLAVRDPSPIKQQSKTMLKPKVSKDDTSVLNILICYKCQKRKSKRQIKTIVVEGPGCHKVVIMDMNLQKW